jgi:1-acyl-sn-glycerol-3-phosphate acyltransferase
VGELWEGARAEHAGAERARAEGARPRGLARDRLFRLWRIFGTGLSFVVFGAVAVVLSLVVFPLCRLWPGPRFARETRVQRVVHHAYRGFVGLMQGLGLFDDEWIGLERLRTPGPHLVVANHPSLIDVVQIVAKLPQADCVMGEAWARNVFTGRAARMAGYVTDAGGADVVETCAERLRAGRTVVLFPEGTRSPASGMHPFRRGAAHVALETGVPLEPIAIHVEPPMLKKNQPWWDVPDRPGYYLFHVGEPIAPAPFEAAGVSRVLAARRMTAALREHIIERSNRARSR